MAQDGGEGGGAMASGPRPESLFPDCKIVRSSSGFLQLKEQNLMKVIMDCVNGYSLPKDIPVVMLAVIGPPSSGKSFLTNLLIQYYKMEGGGGWLEKLTKKGKDGEQPRLTGFVWDSVEADSPGIFKPKVTDLATSGVYLWPQPFIMSIHGDKRQLVWILHLVRGADKGDDDLRTLERFLMLACSRVTEIHVEDGDFRILREASRLKSGQPVNWMSLTQNHICDSIVYLFRSKSASSKLQSTTDRETKQELSKLIKGTGVDTSILDDFKHINIDNIKDIDGGLHDEKGCLNLKVEKNLLKSLKHIVGVITEESEISPKKDNGNEINVGDICQYLRACVNTINSLSSSDLQQHPRQSTVEINPSPPLPARSQHDTSLPPSSLSTKTHHETGTGSKNRNSGQVQCNDTFLETSLDEICADETYPTVPLPLDSDDEGVKDFVVVDKKDCTDQSKQEPHEPQAFTQVKLATTTTTQMYATFTNTAVGSENEAETAPEKVLAPKEKLPTSSSSRPVPLPKVEVSARQNGATGNATNRPYTRSQGKLPERYPEMNVNHRGENLTEDEKLKNVWSRVDKYQSMMTRSYCEQEIRLPHSYQVPAEHPVTPVSSNLPASEMQSDVPGTHSPCQRGRQTEEKTSSCPPQEEEMDTTAPSNSTINNDHPALKSTNGNKETEVEEEPMEIDNSEESEAAKRLLKEKEAKRKAEEEHKRLKALEKQRKLEEKERLEMERQQQHDEMRDVASNAVKQLKSMMFAATKEWLESNFYPPNVTGMGDIYAHVLKGVLAEGHKFVVVQLCWELDQIIDHECRNDCTAYVNSIRDRIWKFYLVVKKKFDFLSCFTDHELVKLSMEEYEKVSTDLLHDSAVQQLVKMGCEKLTDYFREQNERIIKNEERLAENLMPDALTFYNDEMTRFLKEDVYAPNRLKEIHKTLVEKLVEAFKQAFKFTSNPKICERAESKLVALKESLGLEFVAHLKRNDTKVKKTQDEIAKILQKSKSSYVEKIEEVITKNPDGLGAREFEKKQGELVNEARKLLEMEIRKKRKEEPTEAYLKSLQVYIDDYWKCVFEANSKNIKKTKEREEQERKKLEEERNLERQRENERRRSGSLVGKGARKSEEKGNSSRSHEREGVNGQQLPPLVFQLQHTRIKMGMSVNGKPQILRNSNGEESTVLVVGLSKEGGLMYGSEVLANIRQEGEDPSQSSLRKHWWIAEHLTFGDDAWSDGIQLKDDDGTLHKITVEFLLAFILLKLKEQVETDMGGTCSVAIITVPFWLCSTQRIQVKDGGRLAGFSDVYLINEASAAAIACASSDLRCSSAHNILIISENAELIDASVYAYSSYGQKVTMVGHFGTYFAADEKKKLTIRRFVVGACKAALGLIWSSGTEGGKSDEDGDILQAARLACNQAMKQAQDPQYNLIGDMSKPNEMFVIAESAKWRPHLENIGRDMAKKACDIDEENAVIIGAALLSQNLNEMNEKIRDKLAFDVLRQTGVGTANCVIHKNCLLPISTKKANSTFPTGSRQGELFQYSMNCNVRVGSFRLHRPLPPNSQVELCLLISNEAIVTITDVLIVSRYNNQYALKDEYEWITPNLASEEMARLQSLLESLVVKKQESNALSTAKQELKQQCNEMKEQLEAGTVFKIKSAVVKGMFAQKIVDALNVATHEKSTLDQIQFEMDSLAKWSSKYIQ